MFLLILSGVPCYAAKVKVGDSYGGGTVFCVSDTADLSKCVTTGAGEHGLIMANQDQANYDSNLKHGVTWATAYDPIPSAQSKDDGAANTAAIIRTFPKDNPSKNAAWLCVQYIDPIEKHADWYLPAKNELNKMYLFAKANSLIGRECTGSKVNGVQCLVGGYSSIRKCYWSSTEHSGNSYGAWSQYFGDGSHYGHSKFFDCFAVRAIRAFNNSSAQGLNMVEAKAPEPTKAIIKEDSLDLKNSNKFSVSLSSLSLPLGTKIKVGDSYGGGTVFCVSQTADLSKCVTEGAGNYGLIMADKDQANDVPWAAAWDSVPGAHSGDDGAANTAAIIRAFPNDDPSNSAAWACSKYKDPIEGHTDWYLPAKNELNKMYLFAQANNLIGKHCTGSKVNGVQCLVGGGEFSRKPFNAYWSSSEYSSGGWSYCGNAWCQGFIDGHQGYSSKEINRFAVRAIRAFNSLSIQQLNAFGVKFSRDIIEELKDLKDLNSSNPMLQGMKENSKQLLNPTLGISSEESNQLQLSGGKEL